jgi:hypothetical protein
LKFDTKTLELHTSIKVERISKTFLLDNAIMCYSDVSGLFGFYEFGGDELVLVHQTDHSGPALHFKDYECCSKIVDGELLK